MMNRKLKNEIYRRIVREQRPHQEVYDSMIDETSSVGWKGELAEELSKHPSPARVRENSTLRTVFIGLLSVVLLIRLVGLFALFQVTFSGNAVWLLVLVVILGLAVPVIGIIGAAQNRVEVYRAVSFLFILLLLRSFREWLAPDLMTLVNYLPIIACIVLGFWIPSKLRTPYRRETSYVEKNGRRVQHTEYLFEKGEVSGSDLLDAGL